jgi:hypothetical protein
MNSISTPRQTDKAGMKQTAGVYTNETVAVRYGKLSVLPFFSTLTTTVNVSSPKSTETVLQLSS